MTDLSHDRPFSRITWYTRWSCDCHVITWMSINPNRKCQIEYYLHNRFNPEIRSSLNPNKILLIQNRTLNRTKYQPWIDFPENKIPWVDFQFVNDHGHFRLLALSMKMTIFDKAVPVLTANRIKYQSWIDFPGRENQWANFPFHVDLESGLIVKNKTFLPKHRKSRYTIVFSNFPGIVA